MKIVNPKSNGLSSDQTIEKIKAAIEKSGYPLQGLVAKKVRDKKFSTLEEWGYVDKNTKEIRSIDLKAHKELYDYKKHPNTRIRPQIDLIIECKQSKLPYIFFLTDISPWMPSFPLIGRLFNNEVIAIKTNASLSTWNIFITHALGLADHAFIKEPPYCMTFSQCDWKSSGNLELSGSKIYNDIVHPLIKAQDYFYQVLSPNKMVRYFDCHIILNVAVLDAPMLGVRHREEPQLMPWVRVLRHEAYEDVHKFDSFRHKVIDLVHKDFFDDYIEQHLMPYAIKFSELALKHKEVLVSGKAFIKGMEQDSWTNLEKRLQKSGR